MSSKNNYAILMAGGVGSRFWPMSTSNYPKQFHDMLGTGKTLIQHTFDRLAQSIPAENIFILTNARYEDLVMEQLPSISKRQVVLEPAMRNTAPCILYAAMKIYKENKDALMLIAPSDHFIRDEKQFSDNITTAFEAIAKEDMLLTFGIKPTFANTGYGYIKYDKVGETIHKVNQFTEKPDLETAKTFLKAGNYLWNAGIFAWSAKSILSSFEKNQATMYALFEAGNHVYNTEFEDDFVRDNYSKAANISIDYAILEPSENVYVMPVYFDWNDLGTWGSLYNELPKDAHNNAFVGAKPLVLNAKNNMIRTNTGKIIVVSGLKDYIIVDKDDVLMIVPKAQEQDIKQIVQQVKDTYGEELA
jgi:mannose-1-phosphate guanylyltransferase